MKPAVPIAHRRLLGTILKREAVDIAHTWHRWLASYPVLHGLTPDDVLGQYGKWFHRTPGTTPPELADRRPSRPISLHHRRLLGDIITDRCTQIIVFWSQWADHHDPALAQVDREHARATLAGWLRTVPVTEVATVLHRP